MRESTPDNNKKGIDIPMPALVEHATSPIVATLVSNRVMNIWSAARVVEKSLRQEEATHVEGAVDAMPPVLPPHSTARIENVEYDSNLSFQIVRNLNCNVPSSERGSMNVARVMRSTSNPPTRPPVHQGPHRTIDKEVHGLALQPTQPSSILNPRELSLGVHKYRHGGKK